MILRCNADDLMIAGSDSDVDFVGEPLKKFFHTNRVGELAR